MAKMNRYVTLKKNADMLTLQFDTMFYVTVTRREMPPPTGVESPKKGQSLKTEKKSTKGDTTQIAMVSPIYYHETCSGRFPCLS